MNPTEAQAARESIEQFLATGTLPDSNSDPTVSALPESIRNALAAYQTLPEWLVMNLFRRVCRISSTSGDLYLMVHGFESTDGWIEVFAPNGTWLGAAQYIGNRVGWATVEEVLASIQTGQRVPALAVSPDWVEEPDGGCKSACGRVGITPVAGMWRLTMNGEFIQDWGTREDAQAHAQALLLPAE